MDQPKYSQQWARRLLLDLAEHLTPTGREVQEGRAAGVLDEKLLALYPFEYERWHVVRLAVRPSERKSASAEVQESSRLLAEGYWSIIRFSDRVNAEPPSWELHDAISSLMSSEAGTPLLYLPKILLLALDLLARGEAGPACTAESDGKEVSVPELEKWTIAFPEFQRLVEGVAANLQGESVLV